MPNSPLGPLNLSDGDTKGFDALDSGQYNADVFKIELTAVKNEGGKTPVGTPMINVQYRILSDAEGNTDGVTNRRVFQTFVIPPKDHDPKKAQTLKGMLIKFFVALGDDEADVRNAKFDPELSEYVGKECVVALSKEQKRNRDGSIVEGEFVNRVQAVKPAGSISGAASVGAVL